jgi:hypothetical protein
MTVGKGRRVLGVMLVGWLVAGLVDVLIDQLLSWTVGELFGHCRKHEHP